MTADAWWKIGSLYAGSGGLQIAGRTVRDVVVECGTPAYLYDSAAIHAQIATLRAAIRPLRDPRIYYAMKANRFRPVLDLMRQECLGIDACSPAEVALALDAGFAPETISVTASCLSDDDLQQFAASGVHVNFDYPNALARYAGLVPAGTRVGLRIDPGISAGYGIDAKTDYGRGKLGLSVEDLEPALVAAREGGLVIDTLHIHLGWGLRASDESGLRQALATLADAAVGIDTLTTINVGGGLGGRLREGDQPLTTARWALAIAETLGDTGLAIACEPGTLLVASAGVLVARVNAAWTKRGEKWLGLDTNQAVNVYAAHYGLEMEVVAVDRPGAPATERYNITGNINEAGDLFTRGRLLPPLAEGDLVALLPAGAYGSSMASNHCLRGGFAEILL